ncbi:site-specific integrase [Castellaniella sp.]|uniref:tyrosine-type recombinase/integrase n=1 Tax=Castellaniella sp. TaxID=1955812 RepID=UPI0025C00324|nr:site-specific integrase [Castellaniella sp.]
MMGYITDRSARAIKPGDKPVPAGVTGMYLFASTERGRGKWILRYVSPVTGKRRDMGLGSYPDTGVARAIEKALEARQQIQDDIDPILARQSTRAIPTFEKAARDQWEILAPGFRNDKHRQQWISSLEQHAFPSIGGVKVDALQAEHFADMLRPIWLTIPETAKRIKMRCASVMAACRARKYIQGNPLDDVGPLLPAAKQKDATPERHHPAMPWREVPVFVRDHLARQPIMGARAALLFAILTAARSGEVRGMTWAEINFDQKLWTVPADRMKAGRAHRVPLSDGAIALLRDQQHGDDPQTEALVFPALRGGELSDMALTSILRKAQAPSDLPGRVATAHGFRSSFRNWCADHGTSTEVAERCLAHAISNKVQAAYERTDRLDARVKLMAAWADHVMGRVADARVVPIRSTAA